MSAALGAVIESQITARAPDSVVALGEKLRARFGRHALAVLFYGSCRRANDDAGGIVDLYVLVDGYRAAHGNVLAALANRLLAPNVYYLETPFAGRVARAKYAVVSLDQFERGTTHWFHPYLWGRFAQPCGLLFAVDEQVRERVVRALAGAVATFAARTLPGLPAQIRCRGAMDAGPAADLCGGTALGAPGAGARALCGCRPRTAGDDARPGPRAGVGVQLRPGGYSNPVTARRPAVVRVGLDAVPPSGQGAQRAAPSEGILYLRWRTAVPGVENRTALGGETRNHALHAPLSAPGRPRRVLAHVAARRIPLNAVRTKDLPA